MQFNLISLIKDERNSGRLVGVVCNSFTRVSVRGRGFQQSPRFASDGCSAGRTPLPPRADSEIRREYYKIEVDSLEGVLGEI